MSIYDQLNEYCDCVDVRESDVLELVNVLSLALCWQRVSCETFLSGERREVIDLPSCTDCPITFEPYYHPFEVDSFEFYLIKQDGIDEEVTPITVFKYHASDGMFHIDTGLPKCKCGCHSCGCDPAYKLLAVYTAGYDEIPDCLLPVFCDVLEIIRAKNDCKCCDDCACDNGAQEPEYAVGDVVSAQLQEDIGKILVENYKSQLGMMSLCKGYELWGYVV